MAAAELGGRFSIPDYIVFFASLIVSFGIGIYSSCAGKKREKTTEDFYFGDHDMNIVAVAMSLSATFISAIGLLGLPTEIYRNGAGFSVMLTSTIVCGIMAIILFIPFFYNLQLTSVYEYFEHRFNRTIRRCACLLFVISMLLYMSMVLYAPALALSQVSSLPIWVSILISGVICTAYTSIGGMKAVIWTDAFQMGVMITGVLIVLTHGVISAGGLAHIIEANRNTGRFHVDFSPDPTIRHTFWSMLVGGIFTTLPFSLNQATVQRYLSVKDKRSAQRMLAIQVPTAFTWWCVIIAIGATMFAFYQGCDPKLSGRIERSDQMLALFVGDLLGYLQGLPGLFTAVVYSATLSTMSSGVNSIVMVLLEDFIKPFYHRRKKVALTEHSLMRLSHGLSFAVGFTAIGMAFVSSAMGRGLNEFSMSMDGMCGGPMLGLFFCGMMLPYCNSKGAAVGVLSGLLVTFWIGIGAIVIDAPQFPLALSADNCSWRNFTTSHNSMAATTVLVHFQENSTLLWDISSSGTPVSSSGGISWMYRISYQYYALIGFFVTVTVASIVSFATGRQDSSLIPDRFFLYKLFAKETDTKYRPTTSTGYDYRAELLPKILVIKPSRKELLAYSK